MMDGWASYGMTPEQVTPEWKKAREALWKEEVSCHHKGDGFPRSYTAQYKKVFMGQQPMVPAGTEFVLIDLRTGDPDPEEIYTAQVGEAWQLSPFQDEAKWRWAIIERPPTCEGEQQLLAEGIEQLINYRIGYYADIWTNGPNHFWGWSGALRARFNRYLLGESYHPQGYMFEGYQVKPWISPSWWVRTWLDYISSWLRSGGDIDLSVATGFVDYWFSLLDYVHPAFWSAKVRQQGGSLDPVYIKIANSIRYLNNREYSWRQDEKRGWPLSEQGKANREAFLESWQQRILALPKTHPFREFWLTHIGQRTQLSSGSMYLHTMPKLDPEDDAEYVSFSTRYASLNFGKFVPPYFGNSVKEQGE